MGHIAYCNVKLKYLDVSLKLYSISLKRNMTLYEEIILVSIQCPVKADPL